MPTYRIILLDEVGTIAARADHDCADDAAAATLAMTLLAQRAQTEVWLGARLVGSFSAAGGLESSSG